MLPPTPPILLVRRPLYLLVLVALSGPSLAQTSVRDSVKMAVEVYSFQYRSGPDDAFFNCGSGIFATWPDVLADILERPTRYADYTLVATGGQIVPRGLGETLSNPQLEITVPAGHYGHFPSLGAGAQSGGSYSTECPRFKADAVALKGGGGSRLNGQPFRITEWFAVFDVPDGTPIALFEWRQTEDLTAAFDASFESEQSREVDASEPGGKRPVESYSWDFGDGQFGSGARPSHTYAEAGSYLVKLTVTDDDGEIDEQEEIVTVTDHRLALGARINRFEVTEDDEIEFVASLENVGTEPVRNVVLDPGFGIYATFPDSLDAAIQLDPLLEPVDATVGPETRASLGPGGVIELARTYVVTRVGQYRWQPSEPWRYIPVEIEVVAYRGSGEDDDGKPVPVEESCDRGEGTSRRPASVCGRNFADVVPPTYTIEITSEPGSRARTGLQPGPTVDAVRFVRFDPIDEGTLPVCESGCVDFVLTVRDEKGNLGENVDLEVDIEQIGDLPIEAASGGFLCKRVVLGMTGNCVDMGQALIVQTDDKGTARVWAALQAGQTPAESPNGPPDQVRIDAKVTGRAAAGGASPTSLTLPVDPTIIRETQSHRVSDTSAIFAGLTHGIAVGADWISIGNWCESFVGWVRDAGLDAVSLTRQQRNFLLKNGLSQVVPWICKTGVTAGKSIPIVNFLDEVDNIADPAKKVADLFQFAWLAQEYEIDNASDLVFMQFPLPPPLVVWFDGDIVDPTNDIASYAFTQGFVNQPQEMLVQEVTGLTRPVTATSRSDFEPSENDGLLRVRWKSSRGDEVEALITFGYIPVRPGVLIGSDGFLVGYESGSNARTRSAPSSGPRTGTVAEAASAGVASLTVGAWAGEPGEYLVVGDGTDTPEVVQVRTVTAAGDRTALALTTPLRYPHAPGDLVERIAEGTAGVPQSPVLRPHPPFGPPTELAWAAMPTDLASAYDLEVVTDTTAASEVVAAAGLTADSLVVDPDLFAMGVEHFWRVRSSNEVGAGPWSPWQTFTPTAGVSTEPGAAPVEAVALSAPYPNPAATSATVPFAVPEAGPVRLGVFDALGREVARLVDGPRPSGRHEAALETAALPAGVYLVRLVAGGETRTERLTVVR